MAHLYIDDGDVEAEDYANNYIYFVGKIRNALKK
jgi:hypothetical protein